MPPRKYQREWEVLKTKGTLTIEISPEHQFSVEAKRKFFNTFVRAISKEKYGDWVFKDNYPNSLITSEVHVEDGILEMKLTLDSKDISHLF